METLIIVLDWRKNLLKEKAFFPRSGFETAFGRLEQRRIKQGCICDGWNLEVGNMRVGTFSELHHVVIVLVTTGHAVNQMTLFTMIMRW